jgi:DNA-binding beta-propeller fold protein YncE
MKHLMRFRALLLLTLTVITLILAGCAPTSSPIFKGAPAGAFFLDPSKDRLISYSVINSQAQGSAKTGQDPVGITISSDGLSVYVIDEGSDEIQRFSAIGLVQRAVIKLPGPPTTFVLDTSKRSQNGYALIENSPNIYQINVLNNLVVSYFPVGIDPTSIAINTSNDNAYITDAATNTLNIVDLLTRQIKYKIPVEQDPVYSILSPNKTIVYVVCKASGEIVPVSLLSLKPQNPIPVVPGPFKMVINTLHNVGYVASSVIPYLSVINLVTNKLESPLYVRGIPTDIGITKDNYNLYLTESSPPQFVAVPLYLLNTTYKDPLRFVSPALGIEP